MKQIYLLTCLIAFYTALAAQTPANAYLSLQPYEIKGHNNPLKLNITFGNYKTRYIKRSLGSIFNFGRVSFENILLDMAGVPDYVQGTPAISSSMFSKETYCWIWQECPVHNRVLLPYPAVCFL